MSNTDSREWTALTDDDRDAVFASLPNMLDGFMKLWGWLHFAKAIEQKVQEKNADLIARASAHEEKIKRLREALERIVVAANTVAYCYSSHPGNFAAALREMQEDADAARSALESTK